MTELNAEHARRAIVEHTRRLAESAAAAGPDAAVPTAPEWTITDLVEHVGQTQHWVAELIQRRITDPTRLPTEMAGVQRRGAWFVERRPDGATWRPAVQQPDVTLTGPAQSLLLALTRRLPLTDRAATNISVDGDTDLAQHWLDNTAHVSD